MAITSEMESVLKEIIKQRIPEYSNAISKPEIMTSDQINTICSELADELCESGLDKNDTPNERGEIIYKLISYINQYHKR
jgi:hypothetical protein